MEARRTLQIARQLKEAAAALALCVSLLGCSPLSERTPLPAHRPQTRLVVGSYYFPGWFSPERWMPIKEYGSPNPLLGYYDENVVQVADWHIRWASESGISFFAFDWYYDLKAGKPTAHNAALEKGFLRSPLRDRMDFCIFWCNESKAARSVTRQQMLRLAEVLSERYFGLHNYLRVGGRPVVFVSRPVFLLDALGVEGTRDALAAMARRAGEAKGIFFIANAAERFRDLASAGFCALSGYNYASVGVPDCAGKRASYEGMIDGYVRTWKRLFSQDQLPYIPPLSPGWDSRPWYRERGFTRTGATPEKFERMCREVLPFVNPELNMVIVECWNEFGEGSYIEPTEEYGFGWLDAMARVFRSDGVVPTRVVPTAGQRAALAFPDVPAFVERDIAAQGGNLVFNPGFERAYGWLFYDGSSAAPTSDDAHSGRFCLAVPRMKGGAKCAHLIPVQCGRRYALALWVKGRAKILCAIMNRDRKWTGRYQQLGLSAGGDEWTQFKAESGIDDPEAGYVTIEMVPLDDCVFADDVDFREAQPP